MDAIEAHLEPVLAHLRPYTRSIPQPIIDRLNDVFGKEVVDTVFLDLQINEASLPYIKEAVSKLLGIGIISASSIVKIPQIMTILKNKSVKGLSFASYVLETLSYFISLSYNFRKGNPFSTFGETSLMSVQNILIMFLILTYSRSAGVKINSLLVLLLGLAYSFFGPKNGPGVINDQLLTTLQILTIPLSISSKIPQILANFKNRNCGQLSSFAVANYLLGSVARIFTTLQSVNDNIILGGFLAGGLFNLILALQMVIYGGEKSKVKKN